MKPLHPKRQRDDDSSDSQSWKDDGGYKKSHWGRWLTTQWPWDTSTSIGEESGWLYSRAESSILNGMTHTCLCHLSNNNPRSKIMKEVMFLVILIFIAFMLGWIINEVQNLKKEHEHLGETISQTMRDEFEYDRQTYKFVLETND